MSQQVETTEINKLLEAAGGSYLAAFDLLVAQKQAQEVSKLRPPTKAQRIEAVREVIESQNTPALAEMKKVMTRLVRLITKATPIDPADLTVKDTEDLVDRFAAMDKLMEFATAERAHIRDITFAAISEKNAEIGVIDPENFNGQIEVPTRGKRLCKEGAGRKAPRLRIEADETGPGLKDLLGKRLWAQVCEEEVVPEVYVPEHVEQTFSVKKCMELAQSQPDILEKVRDALEVGEFRTPRFIQRDL